MLRGDRARRGPELVLDEFRRLLPDYGLLLVSTPNRDVYPPGNPFHIHEFRPDELRETLSRRFRHVRLYQQRSHYSTAIVGTNARVLRPRRLSIPETPRLTCTLSPSPVTTSCPTWSRYCSWAEPRQGAPRHDLAWSWQERVVVAEAAAHASDLDAQAARRESGRSLELLEAAAGRNQMAAPALGLRARRITRRAARAIVVTLRNRRSNAGD